MTIEFVSGAPLRVPHLEAYWRDPRQEHAARAANLARHNAAMSEHDARVRRQMMGDDL